VVDPDGVFTPLRAQADLLLDRGFLHGSSLDAVTWVSSAAQAFDELDLFWADGPPPTRRPTEAEVLEGEA
jgi:hypothetical protein